MEKYSMADFELYYFITDDDLFPAGAAMQVFLPCVRAAVVTLAIWNAQLCTSIVKRDVTPLSVG